MTCSCPDNKGHAYLCCFKQEKDNIYIHVVTNQKNKSGSSPHGYRCEKLCCENKSVECIISQVDLVKSVCDQNPCGKLVVKSKQTNPCKQSFKKLCNKSVTSEICVVQKIGIKGFCNNHSDKSCCDLCCSGVVDGKSFCCEECQKVNVSRPCSATSSKTQCGDAKICEPLPNAISEYPDKTSRVEPNRKKKRFTSWYKFFKSKSVLNKRKSFRRRGKKSPTPPDIKTSVEQCCSCTCHTSSCQAPTCQTPTCQAPTILSHLSPPTPPAHTPTTRSFNNKPCSKAVCRRSNSNHSMHATHSQIRTKAADNPLRFRTTRRLNTIKQESSSTDASRKRFGRLNM